MESGRGEAKQPCRGFVSSSGKHGQLNPLQGRNRHASHKRSSFCFHDSQLHQKKELAQKERECDRAAPKNPRAAFDGCALLQLRKEDWSSQTSKRYLNQVKGDDAIFVGVQRIEEP